MFKTNKSVLAYSVKSWVAGAFSCAGWAQTFGIAIRAKAVERARWGITDLPVITAALKFKLADAIAHSHRERDRDGDQADESE